MTISGNAANIETANNGNWAYSDCGDGKLLNIIKKDSPILWIPSIY